jgi:cardiolipin synthase
MSAATDASKRIASLPNVISALRLSTVPLFVWLFSSGRENAAVLIYMGAAGSDFLDGYIARRTGAITELGQLLDPLADRVFIIALAMALVGRSTLPRWLALVIVGRDLAVLTAWPLLELRRVPRIPVNVVGKAATALLLIGLSALALSETTYGRGRVTGPLGRAATLGGTVAYWAAAALYARAARTRLALQRTGGAAG